MKITGFFQTLSKITKTIFFLQTSTSRSYFRLRFLRTLYHFTRIFNTNYGKCQDFQKFVYSNLIFQKFVSKAINTLYFSNEHVEICIPPFFVKFQGTFSKAQFFITLLYENFQLFSTALENYLKKFLQTLTFRSIVKNFAIPI